MTDPERIADQLRDAIQRIRTDNRLEAMWSPQLVDPEIPMDEAELDEFLNTFAHNDRGERLEAWIRGGATCEAKHRDTDAAEVKRCTKLAVASVDWYAVTMNDSVLVCRDDVREVYRSIMVNDVAQQGLTPDLTINGKAIPRIPAAEKVT